MAPVRGFETYVGSKTTFNIVNSHNVREMLQGLRHWTSTKVRTKRQRGHFRQRALRWG